MSDVVRIDVDFEDGLSDRERGELHEALNHLGLVEEKDFGFSEGRGWVLCREDISDQVESRIIKAGGIPY